MGSSSETSECLNNKSTYITINVNVVRSSINVAMRTGATIGLPLGSVLYVLKILGCDGCIGIG
jgi:hypothetical protein